MKIRKRSWFFAILILLVLLAGAAAALGWWLGADIKGARLARLQASPHYADGAFFNVERQAPLELTLEYLTEQFFGDQIRQPPGRIPVIAVPPAALAASPGPGLRAIWLGHAGVLLEIDGHRLLVDPVFSKRASPFQFFGPERFHAAPIPLPKLRGIEAVMISHDHYDHLDEATIKHLSRQGTQFFLPLGIGAHLQKWGVPVAQIHELDWGEERKLGALRLIATPNRHYSGRGLFDFKATLWSSWTVIGPRHRVFYSGDTGYSKLFKKIGRQFGPFDLTLIKIGAYGPGASWLDVHMTPEDAIRVHRDLAGRRMLPVHWATFNLAIHDWDEPIIRALAAANKAKVELLTPRIGEVVRVGQNFVSTRWWEKLE